MKEKKVSFEEAMEQLEHIVAELETGELSLEESVAQFQQGMELSKYCHQQLEQAEKSITILVEQAGTMQEEKFDAE